MAHRHGEIDLSSHGHAGTSGTQAGQIQAQSLPPRAISNHSQTPRSLRTRCTMLPVLVQRTRVAKLGRPNWMASTPFGSQGPHWQGWHAGSPGKGHDHTVCS